jgi:hypothetical protein
MVLQGVVGVARTRKTPGGKVQLLVYISEEVYDATLVVSSRLYEKLRGAISRFVEEALREKLVQVLPRMMEKEPELGASPLLQPFLENTRKHRLPATCGR